MTVVAIDGPSGSGKSTVARALAEHLELEYLDTGAMYRAVAFAVLRRGVDPYDDSGVTHVVQGVELVVDGPNVVVDGVDASIEIRGPEVTQAVSAVSANPAVRRELVARQRDWIETRGGGVVEGRDIGTEVWPDAELKVYLTADLDVRATRRSQELGEPVPAAAVATDLARRDQHDSSRAASPLRQADGALVIDTTDRPVADIVAELLERLS